MFIMPTHCTIHPVDEKVEQWIRRDYLLRQRFERELCLSAPHQDDMHLDHATVYRERAEPFAFSAVPLSRLQRSFSLSNLNDNTDDTMDIDMIG